MTIFRHVGLVLGSHGEANRGFARGIASYSRLRSNWIFHAIDLVPAQVPSLVRWKPDGIIAVLVDQSLGQAVCSIGVPVVNVAKLYGKMDLPRVDHDDVAIGRMAAEHLLERGFRQFGFVGLPVLPYSLLREQGFTQTVQKAGFTSESFYLVNGPEALRNASGWPEDESSLGRWLKSLPKPSGVMVCSDWHGWKVAEVCRDQGIQVPEEIAMIGVDNDEPWCSLSHPPLSSVVVNAERIGFEAACLLELLMNGENPSNLKPVELPPVTVITRRSSDTVAIDDPDVSEAVRFIRENAHKVFGVDEVVQAVATSRRSLERRFKSAIGRSIREEIDRVHCQRAKDLLVRTDLAMPQVAQLSGYTNAKRFCEAFQRQTRCTPTEYRERYRARR